MQYSINEVLDSTCPFSLKFENVNNIQELQKNDPVKQKYDRLLVATLHLPITKAKKHG